MKDQTTLPRELQPFLLLTEQQASAVTGLRVPTLRNWRHLRKGPPYRKLHGSIRYSLQDLLAWCEARKIQPEGT